MDLREHAEIEMKLARLTEQDEDYKNVMSLIEHLMSQQSPTWQLVVNMFYQVCNFENLTPLTGVDDEWEQVTPQLKQNKRCKSVFKELGVGCYDARALVFIGDDDRMFTKQPQSRKMVTFPYTPHTQYMKVSTGPKIVVPYGTKGH